MNDRALWFATAVMALGVTAGVATKRTEDASARDFEDRCYAHSGYVAEAPLTDRWICRSLDNEIVEVGK